MSRRTQDGMDWELDPAFAPWLEEVLRSAGRPVKSTPLSAVTVHDAGGRQFYVKRYFHERVKGRPFKYWFKPSPARKEWSLAARLEARNIPVVRHVALGERWSLGLRESALITEAFDGEPLGDGTDVPFDRLLALVERMHDQGVLQRDLHPANILWSRSSDELRLVDLHGVVLRPGLSAEERQANLAYLLSALPPRASLSPDLRHQADLLRRELLARRARRCLRRNRDFDVVHAGGLRWHCRRSRRGEVLDAVMADPDGFLKGDAARLKTGRSSTVGRGGGVVVKRYNFKKALNAIKDLCRPSKARRAYLKGYHLELAGVPTAKMVAAADRRWGMFLRCAYLIMDEIPGAVALNDCGERTCELASGVAGLLALLHERGFSHRDLKASNILLDKQRRPHLIDMEGLRYVGLVAPIQAGRDLARLARSLGGRAGVPGPVLRRFVRCYCETRGLRPSQLRPARPR